jgi:predicted alpha-1,2-mannosidase
MDDSRVRRSELPMVWPKPGSSGPTAQLHPNVFEDVDGSYLGFDGQVHAARGHTHYANFSLWDTYKAEDQLLATIAPDRYRDMLLSLLDDYQQGGKLPRWGEENIDPAHMSGDPAISMIADGACRGLLTDAEQAALEGAALDLVGRRSPSLAQLGYLPGNPGTTLEYGVADFSLALLADRAGDRAGAAAALVRSGNWQNVFDPTTQWVRPRNADGSWATPFDPTDETGFQEGNSWQYSWLAPHDGHRLLAAMGGDGPATQRLDQLFAAPAEVQTRLTGYGTVYRAPQYAPGNEHDIQVPWMYAFAGQQWKVADELRNVQHVFRPTVDGLPGNDDLGGLSSWQVFSVLGFGPVIPGAPLFVVGSPLFDRVSIRVPGGRFTIEAPGASVASRFVQSATLNGSTFDASWFPASAVRAGGVLHLDMGAVPNASWGTAPPPSVDGTGDLGAFGCRAGGDRLGGRAP